MMTQYNDKLTRSTLCIVLHQGIWNKLPEPFFILGLSLAIFACDDESQVGLQPVSLAGTAMQAGEATNEPAGNEQISGMQAPSAGDQIQTECQNPQECSLGYCFQGQCVEEVPCAETSPVCAEGYICIGGLCYENAQSAGTEVIPSNGSLVFEPNRLRFTYNNAGDRSQNLANLVNTSDRPLNLERMVIEGSSTFTLVTALALPFRLSPNEPLSIEIEYLANDPNGDQADLVAYTSEGLVARLPLYSETKGAGGGPCLEITPNQVYFGSVVRGQSVDREVSLSSCGNRAVTVNGIRRGSSIFGELPQTFSWQAPNLPVVLEPGQSIPFTVTYSAQRAGLEAGFIEVFSDDTMSPSQRVDLSAIAEPPPLGDVELHVRLDWNTDLTDVDLHLIAPNGVMWTCEGDCFFSNGSPNWGDQQSYLDDPFLDVDDVDGFGPENINLESPLPGTYKVFVHYYAAHEGSDPDAEIKIINFGQEIASFGPQRLSAVDQVWEVAEIDFPSLAIRSINQITQHPRNNLCGGF